jgi:hypothetical protein
LRTTWTRWRFPVQPKRDLQSRRIARVSDARSKHSRGQRISAGHLERWAELVHGSDDVTLDPADEEFLAGALFELSTPDLFGAMADIVAELRDRDGG